ncbi:hypothetical protein MASR1M32_15210 [Rhodobacter sp.]
MKGSTKTMARASASGITAMPDTKAKVENTSNAARSVTSPSARPDRRRLSPIAQVIGSISRHCTTKRAAVIWPTGMPPCAASLEQTSRSGASRQKASISRMPGRMRSECGAGTGTLVIPNG